MMAPTRRPHEHFLPQLVSAYRRQTLVPFLGAGMSVPSFRLWQEFVAELERIAQVGTTGGAFPLERSHRALQALRRGGQHSLSDALRSAMRSSSADEVTKQTEALAEMQWPLVLTTNYDDLYYRAASKPGADGVAPADVRILGRGEADCRRVLGSLYQPGDRVLWALHGYIGNARPPAAEFDPHLSEEQLVVGHEEYRRVLHHEVHFRRAFAEVLRSRTILFLGCSLGDPDVLGLLDEVVALVGPGIHPHYAVLFACEESASDKERMLQDRLGVTPIVLPEYADLERFLRALVDDVRKAQPRQVRWSFDLSSPFGGRAAGAESHLEVARGGLPTTADRGQIVVVSAGVARYELRSDGAFPLYFSEPIRDLLRGYGIDPWSHHAVPGGVVPLPRPDGAPTPVVAAFARSPTDEDEHAPADARDARLIHETTLRVLKWASEHGRPVIHCQLLASGDGAPYAPRVALSQMLRAFGAWHRDRSNGSRLIIHVMKEELLAELSAGRLDLLELLEPDTVRLWVEVCEGGYRFDRLLLFERYDTSISELANRFYVNGLDWAVRVIPHPEIRSAPPIRVALCQERTLDALGLLPGSTLRFERLPDRDQSPAWP